MFPTHRTGAVRRFAAVHPIASFLLLAYPIGWTIVVLAAAADLPGDAAGAAGRRRQHPDRADRYRRWP
jgi:hypothetical protein